LWLDRYLPDHDTGSGQTLVSDATKIPVPDAYHEFYLRWQAALEQGAGIVTKAATVLGRLSVGLGGESVLETAITLHHTYGVPYIPGSALKGLAANYARNRLDATAWGVKSDAYQIMFGHTASAGYVTFFDALYVPDKEHDTKPLWPDVITVHHPDYYQRGNAAPADWDSPTPIPFVTATGDYLIAIGGDPAWVQKAFEILALALKEEGVGAKTSSGYGRMRLDVATKSANIAEVVKSMEPEDPIAAMLLRSVQVLPIAQVPSQMPQLAEKWRGLASEPEVKRQIAAEIVAKISQAKREKTWADKPWYQELLACLQVA
jgi:CRISPR-associated protein Cmr6